MIFIYGSKSETADLGATEDKHCPVCRAQRSFHLFLQYTYSHMYYFFGAVGRKRYYYRCPTCNHEIDADTNAIQAKLLKNPIPFMHRFGCAVGCLGLIVLFALIALLVQIFDL